MKTKKENFYTEKRKKKERKNDVMDGNYMKRVAMITMPILIVLVVAQADDDPRVQVQTSADEHFKYCEGRNLLFQSNLLNGCVMCGVSALVFNKGFFLANVIEKEKP